MTADRSDFPSDKTEGERRKNLDDRNIDDLDLAGGVEGGMQAGSAGGPGENDSRNERTGRGGRSPGGTDDRR